MCKLEKLTEEHRQIIAAKHDLGPEPEPQTEPQTAGDIERQRQRQTEIETETDRGRDAERWREPAGPERLSATELLSRGIRDVEVSPSLLFPSLSLALCVSVCLSVGLFVLLSLRVSDCL